MFTCLERVTLSPKLGRWWVMADILSFDGDKVMAGGFGYSHISAIGCLDMEVRCNPQDGP
jgi:hypothetical protein